MYYKKVDEIMLKVIAEWKKRMIDGKFLNIPKDANLSEKFLFNIREMVSVCPHEDGKLRIVDAMTGKTHLVPVEEVILNGIKQSELAKYQIES